MAPRGRPPIRADQRRDVVISVRVRAAQADQLFRLAQQQRTSLSALLRRAIWRVAKQP